MPEKTLKEKVERARERMRLYPGSGMARLAEEALSALEARVEELESLLEIERKHDNNPSEF